MYEIYSPYVNKKYNNKKQLFHVIEYIENKLKIHR